MGPCCKSFLGIPAEVGGSAGVKNINVCELGGGLSSELPGWAWTQPLFPSKCSCGCYWPALCAAWQQGFHSQNPSSLAGCAH